MGKLSSGSLSFFLKLQCAPAREERSHVTSDLKKKKKAIEFSILQSFVQIYV
jgi:hypothetical protein